MNDFTSLSDSVTLNDKKWFTVNYYQISELPAPTGSQEDTSHIHQLDQSGACWLLDPRRSRPSWPPQGHEPAMGQCVSARDAAAGRASDCADAVWGVSPHDPWPAALVGGAGDASAAVWARQHGHRRRRLDTPPQTTGNDWTYWDRTGMDQWSTVLLSFLLMNSCCIMANTVLYIKYFQMN